jgi:GLPGLI family protein
MMICGCSGGSFLENRPSEGVIEYALSFPDYDPNGLMAGMLPERTTLTFTDGKQVAELNAGMGIFKTAMIADNGAKLMDYHMSMMSKKLVSHMQPRDLEIFNTDRQHPTILFTQDMDTIAGYPCRRAIAIFDKVDQPEIEIWYTDRIKLKDPNWFGPFSEIPGVMLRYELYQHGIRMRLDAISVTSGPVDDTKFKVKEEYQQVPAEVLHSELAQVLGTFKM